MTPSPEQMWRTCTALSATVDRTTGSMVFLTLPAPFLRATTRKVDGWSPAAGDALEVAGQDGGFGGSTERREFKVLLVKVGAVIHVVGVPAQFEGVLPAPAPPPRPAWIPALAQHGLISSWAARFSVKPKHHGLPPVMLVDHLHPTPKNLKRGTLQYDWKWLNDTNDPVADFAVLAQTPGVFAMKSVDRDDGTITFTVKGQEKPVVAECEPGNLDPLAAAMNRELERLGRPRRIYSWTTGSDSVAFLGRTPDEVEKLRKDVPVGQLVVPEAE